jgi:hypothetical protein
MNTEPVVMAPFIVAEDRIRFGVVEVLVVALVVWFVWKRK